MSLQSLHTRLQAVHSYVRRLFVMEGSARVLSKIALCLIALFLMDYLMDLPRAVRLILLLSAVGYCGYHLYHYLLYPLSRTITEDDIAVAVERHYPELRERLISSLQLSRMLEREQNPAFRPSETLIEALNTETEQATQNLDFQKAFFAHNLKRVATWMAVYVLVIGAYSAVYPQETGVFFQRLIGMDVQYPAKSHLFLEEPAQLTLEHPAMAAPYGKVMEFRLRVEGVVPKKAYFYQRTLDEDGEVSDDWEYFEMTRLEGTDLFAFKTSPLRRSIDFYFTAGDGRLPRRGEELGHFSISVDYPPKLDPNSIAVVYDYPEYTGKQDTDPTKPVRDYNLKAPEGTVVVFKANANVPLGKAYMELYADKLATEPMGPPIPFEVSGNSFSGTLTISTNAKYSLILEKTNGVSNYENPVRGDIEATPDQIPTFSVDFPTTPALKVMTTAKVPFKLTVKDDYGLMSVYRTGEYHTTDLQLKQLDPYTFVLKAEEEDATGFKRTVGENDVAYGADKIQCEYRLDLEPLKLPEGSQIKVRVEATDNKVGTPNIGYTKHYTIYIISEEEVRQQISAMLRALIQTLEQIRQQQERLNEEVTRKWESVGTGIALSEDTKLDLRRNKTTQFRIGNDLGAANDQLMQIIALFDMNGIKDEGIPELRKAQGLLKDLIDFSVQQAQGNLETAFSSADAKEQADALAEALKEETRIVDNLAIIIKMLDRYRGINELIQIAKRIEKIQQKIIDELGEKVDNQD